MSVTKTCNEPLEYVRKFAPSLAVARATLLPFEALIVGESAGPQGEETGDPYFAIEVLENGLPISFTVTADKVTATTTMFAGEEEVYADAWETTLKGLWDYLRQLPLPANSFRRRSRR